MPDVISEKPKSFLIGRHNVVLIGMPGVGKSTVGVLLAKALGYGFVDTDLIIQMRQRKSLQQIIDAEGLAAFQRIEEGAVLSVRVQRHVIATGGSVVYHDPAMQHLRRNAVICFLHARLEIVRQRIDNLDSRGIAMRAGQTLAQLYTQRLPLYRKYADIVVECSRKSPGETSKEIMTRLGVPGGPSSMRATDRGIG